MSQVTSGASERQRSLRDWRPPERTGPIALLVVSAAGILVALWGGIFANPGITIDYYDAGPMDRFAINEVTPYPEIHLYIVGMEDGQLRPLDGRIEASGCSVRWLPNDERGRGANPGQRPGVFEDRCSGALWAMTGDALSDTLEPMRVPHFQARVSADGEERVFVELINHPISQ